MRAAVMILLMPMLLALAGCPAATGRNSVTSGVVSLSADVGISSPTGLYSLKVPDHRWLQLPAGTNNEDSDIELRGPNASTRIVSYVNKNVGANLNSVVASRRDHFGDQWGRIGYQEERVLLAEANVPISYARYVSRGGNSSRTVIYWVATVVTEQWIVEVLGRANGLVSSQDEIEQVVRSLRMTEPGEGT